jgi:hypothetical protein
MIATGGLSSGRAAAALDLHRFGFGPRGDTVETIAADPRGALLAVWNGQMPASCNQLI